jgi:hypothetical protein
MTIAAGTKLNRYEILERQSRAFAGEKLDKNSQHFSNESFERPPPAPHLMEYGGYSTLHHLRDIDWSLVIRNVM